MSDNIVNKRSLDTKDEADQFLEDLLLKIPTPTISDIIVRANEEFKDDSLKVYFINQGKQKLSER